MANVRRTAREIRLEAIVELQNELNQLKNEQPVDDMWVRQYNDYKLYELDSVKDNLIKTIEAYKLQKKVEDYFAGEGAELKAEIERRKSELKETYKTINNDIEALAEECFVGTPWTVQLANVGYMTASIEVTMMGEDGKRIFGTDLRIRYDRKWYGDKAETFETNIGTCGSHDLLDDSYGTRAYFYIQVGMLHQNKAMLENMRNGLAAIVDRQYKASEVWENIKQVEHDPFSHTLAD